MIPLLRRAWTVVWPPLVLFALFVAAWHGAIVAFGIREFLVPSPATALGALVERRADLARAALFTAAGAAGGFASSLLVGIVIALAFSQSSAIRRAAYPYAIFLQTVPIVAIAPLIVLWFGSGFLSVCIVSFIIAVFPIITNATAGLTSMERTLVELFEVNGATRWQTLFRLRLPGAVPNIVTGARVSSGLSVIGAIVGELFAGFGSDDFGLGYLIYMTSGQLKTPLLFAAIFVSTLLGLAIFGLVSLVGDMIVARWSDKR